MPMTYKAKEALRGEIGEKFNKASAAIIAEYRGLTVEEITELRVQLRESEAEFTILKNRVAKKAMEDECKDSNELSGDLTGPVGAVFVYGDPAQATKSVLEFAKAKDNFSVKSGMMDGKVVSIDDLKAIASLPSKEVLLAKIVGSLVSPHRGLVTVLSGVPRNLVQVINAIKDTKAS